MAICVSGLLTPGSASAGTYDVYACDFNNGGGGASSFGGWADSGLTAYTNCGGGEGIVARSGWDNGNNTWFQGAYQVFDAPPGDVVESLHAYIKLQRPGCEWGVGAVASGGDLAGRTLWYLPASNSCSFYGIDWTWQDMTVNDSRVRIEARCGAASCHRGQSYAGSPGVAEAQIRGARVTVRDESAPQLTNGRGGLWTSGGAWLSGGQDVGFDASDASGIRETSVIIDGSKIRTSAKGCDYTQRAPCPNEGMSASLDTAAIRPDGTHTLTLQGVDTAGNPADATQTIRIDNSPPGAPSALTIDGGDGWRSANDFHLTWKNPSGDAGSPIASAEYQLCPSNGGTCVRGSRSGSSTDLRGLSVPRAGDWTAQLWLRDSAGNQDPRNSPNSVHLRYDDEAPKVAIEAPNPADPTAVAAKASDAISGVADGHIEIRPKGSDTWQTLPSTYDGTHVNARLDDEHLKAGSYDLRAYAIDRAGNERTSQDLVDGGSAVIGLPIRIRTHLRAGIAQRRSGHRRSIRTRARIHVRYGHAVRLSGRLLSTDGNPVQDAEVLVYSQARRTDAPVRVVASVRTSRLGGFSYRAPKGVSRTIRFRFNGTSTIRPSLHDVALLVTGLLPASVDGSGRGFL